jgi:UDP-glucose 4,6-dehydratase
METDEPNFTFRQNNCSFYSGSKALGEEVLGSAANCFIWRIRMPFNHIDSERNLLSKLARYPRLVDARNSLSHLGESVAAAVECWRRRIPVGTYHLTNSGSLTTREIVELLVRHRVRAMPVEFFEDEKQFRSSVATPRSHCVLDNRKALSAGLTLSDVRDAIERSLCEWQWR